MRSDCYTASRDLTLLFTLTLFSSFPTGPAPVDEGLATPMQPIYTPDNTVPAYQLNWGLTLFWRETPISDNDWFLALQHATEADGVRVLKHRFTTGSASQFFVSTKPHRAL